MDFWRQSARRTDRFSLWSQDRFLKAVAGLLVLCLVIQCFPGSPFLSPASVAAQPGQAAVWREVDENMWMAEFKGPQDTGNGGSRILVLRIDPGKYQFQLYCASEHGRQRLTVKDWCEKYGLLGAFNAGMYQEDGITSVGYLRNFHHVNNSHVNQNRAVLAFNPDNPELPRAQIIDRDLQDFDSLKPRYRSLVQSIRMVSLHGKNVWSQQPGGWSTLAIALNRSGEVLVIFNEARTSVYDLIEHLLALPLSIVNAMYLEGGPQASLFLNTREMTVAKYGSLDNVLDHPGGVQIGWPIPNVIGITRR
jgi:hypothetical protein